MKRIALPSLERHRLPSCLLSSLTLLLSLISVHQQHSSKLIETSNIFRYFSASPTKMLVKSCVLFIYFFSFLSFYFSRSSNIDLSIVRYSFSLFYFKFEIINSLALFLSFFAIYRSAINHIADQFLYFFFQINAK